MWCLQLPPHWGRLLRHTTLGPSVPEASPSKGGGHWSSPHRPKMVGVWAHTPPPPQVQSFCTSDLFPQIFKSPAISEPTPRAAWEYLQPFCSTQPKLFAVTVLTASPKPRLLFVSVVDLVLFASFCLFALVMCLNSEHNPTPPERGRKDFLVYLPRDVWEEKRNSAMDGARPTSARHWGLGQHRGDKQGRRAPLQAAQSLHAGWLCACSRCLGWGSGLGTWFVLSPNCTVTPWAALLGHQTSEAPIMFWPERTPGPSSERLCSIRGGQAAGTCSQSSPSLTPTWRCLSCISTPARQKPRERGQDPSLTTSQQLKTTWENGGCKVLHPTLQDVLLEPSWPQTKISAHTIFSIVSPRLLEAWQMCPGYSPLKTATCVDSIFLTYWENNLIFVMSLRNNLINDIKLLSSIHWLSIYIM